MDKYIEPLSMDLLGPYLILMGVETTVLVVFNVIIELQWFPILKRYVINRLRERNDQNNKFKSSVLKNWECEKNEIEDEDVASERERIEGNYYNSSIGEENDILKTHRLTKIFRSGTLKSLLGFKSENKVAVNNVTVGIKRGECFGWLGLNGAGKSTTFKMLTNIFLPTQGQFRLSFTGKHQESFIGYCPQVDSLDPLIKVEDLLYIYARLKGIPIQQTPKAVAKSLEDMDLVYIYINFIALPINY